ncbi:hypothetical protein CSKR_109548 [Clonorchis sinensis]|uniref:Uncharacterized protein n=1 Tax=Clonorchis sinensis TaxID=79923 RepID=A0A3R7DAD8_CLOSI|nr:hypothetical protein CSKR_109548 [Clonorchis sinensis]
MTCQKGVKEITKSLGVVVVVRLPGWGPRDPTCVWLETLVDMQALTNALVPLILSSRRIIRDLIICLARIQPHTQREQKGRVLVQNLDLWSLVYRANDRGCCLTPHLCSWVPHWSPQLCLTERLTSQTLLV